MSGMATRVATFGTTIFTEINMLAQHYDALNLGQGKPDFDAPTDVVEKMVEALRAGAYNQYAPGTGSISLRQAVANHARRFYQMDIDQEKGVVVTSGASEGLVASIMGLVDPGDEVIVMEPYFDLYVPAIIMAHAIPVYVRLHPPTWNLNSDELRAAFSKKTRAIILNTPHNPTGHVFSLEELKLVAELCVEHDVTVISDEVYEHLTFAPARHIPIATLPGMFNRTVTVSSGGKSFSATGWKVGWVYGHPDVIEGVERAHQFITFSVHYPAQEAIAYALMLPDSYFAAFQSMYETKCRLFIKAIEGSGLKYIPPEGTYFLMADFSDLFSGTSTEFTHYLIKHAGISGLPLESFYCPEHVDIGQGQTYLRFAFCKSDDVLRQVKQRLEAWQTGIR